MIIVNVISFMRANIFLQRNKCLKYNEIDFLNKVFNVLIL